MWFQLEGFWQCVVIDMTDILDTFHLPRLKVRTVFEE